jgi:hypothetical protein
MASPAGADNEFNAGLATVVAPFSTPSCSPACTDATGARPIHGKSAERQCRSHDQVQPAEANRATCQASLRSRTESGVM